MNQRCVLHGSSAETATVTGAWQTNDAAVGIKLYLDISAISGAGATLTVKLQAKDPISGNAVDLPGGAFAAKTATGTSQLIVYPGVAETANESVSDCLPREYRFVGTISGTTPSITFSLAGDLMN